MKSQLSCGAMVMTTASILLTGCASDQLGYNTLHPMGEESGISADKPRQPVASAPRSLAGIFVVVAKPTTTTSTEGTPLKTNFTGTTTRNNNLIFNITNIEGGTNSLKVGDSITGPCINPTPQNSLTEIMIKPVTITSIVDKDAIRISEKTSDNPECDASGKPFTATRPAPPPPAPKSHVLVLNELLSNQRAIFGNERPQEGATSLGQKFAKPLGNSTYDIYLRPGYSQQYSDFVLFVLEATLQSTSASGGASGKSTPPKIPAALEGVNGVH
jgi:hypothetical protein